MDLMCICPMANDVKHLFLCLFVYLCLYLFKHLGGKVFSCSLMSTSYRLCSHVTNFPEKKLSRDLHSGQGKEAEVLFGAGCYSLLKGGKILFHVSVSVTQYNNNTDYCFIPLGRPSSFASYDVRSFVAILKALLSLAETRWLGLGSRR